MQDFHFSRRERQGVALVISFLLGCIFLPEIPLYSNNEPEAKPLVVSTSVVEKPIKKEVYTPKKEAATSKTTPRKATKKVIPNKVKSPNKQYPKTDATPSFKPIVFDPNTASTATLIQAGIPKKVANTIDNYRQKNGRFYKKEDLQKIYGLKTEVYDKIAPYIQIKKQAKSPSRSFTKKSKPVRDSSKVRSETTSPTFFKFNPNTASESDLKKLGLSDKVVSNLLRYRSKGGTFYKKEQLQKIYGLKESTYQKLEQYIDLPSRQTSNKYPEKKASIIDINLADAEAFQQLRGIGPSYSKRIVKFRNALGGFHSIEQIGETWGFPDSTFQKIKPFLKLDKNTSVKQIALNEADVETLKAHPYINWKKANIILNYKKQHGDFESIEALKNIHAISEEMYEKMAPYLKL